MKKTHHLIVMKVNKQILSDNIHKEKEKIENNQKLKNDIALGMDPNKKFGKNYPKSNEIIIYI